MSLLLFLRRSTTTSEPIVVVERPFPELGPAPTPQPRLDPAFSFVICKSTGEDIGEATYAKTRSFTRTLNQPRTATIALQLGDEFSPNLLPSANPRLKVFRSPTAAELVVNPSADRELVFYGLLPRKGYHADAASDTVTCTFQDPRWWLTRRYALGTETYAATDQGLILWSLINVQNARTGGETWIRQGATTTGIKRDRSFARTLLSQLFDDMTKLIDGCDVDFAPVDYFYDVDGSRVMGLLNVYDQQGSDRPNAVFGYNPDGISNVANATLDFQDITTLAQVTGTAADGTPVIGNAGTPNANGAGLLEQVTADQDVSQQATVDAKAQGILAEEGADRAIVGITGPLPTAPQPFVDYDLGDTIRVAIMRGAFQVISTQRVMGFTVNVSQEGALDTTLVLADPPGTYVAPIVTPPSGGGSSGGGSSSGDGSVITAPSSGATIVNPDTDTTHSPDVVISLAVSTPLVVFYPGGSLNGLTVGKSYIVTTFARGNDAAPSSPGTGAFQIYAADGGGTFAVSGGVFGTDDKAHIWNATLGTRQAWQQLSVTFTATATSMRWGVRMETPDDHVKAYLAGWAIARA